ncbi:hypothetical protein TNCV_300271 [Trichonephila clavipes]|nr:hypothetical protein TNCV_300271 [Trichonephila clavipes]
MIYHSYSIGERPGDLAGQRNTLTPYRACWVTTGPVSGTVVLLVGAPVAWGPRIIDTADTAVATPLALAEISETNEDDKDHKRNSPFEIEGQI